jgi:DNA polymerase-1
VKPLLYLVDGSSQMYRAFHAPIRTSEGTPLRDAQGRPTNAVYIFVTMLRKLVKEHRTDYIAASFDLPGRTFRDDLAADYKANRPPMPDDLAAQIPLVHRACRALGVPIITHERYEADDVIGTVAMRAKTLGFDVAIVTGDKDFFQLVGDGVRVFNPRDEGTWYDDAGVEEKFGVTPAQVVDVLALMGDTTDNIKGVPGIGEKGARDLIAAYGSLDALLAHAAEVPQKKYREALLANEDAARSSRELLRIRTDVPLDVDVNALHYRGPTPADCYELFAELGFRSLVMEFAPTAETSGADYALITSTADLAAFAQQIAAAGRVALCAFPDRPATQQARLLGLSLATSPKAARYVPLGPPPGARSRAASTGTLLDVAEPVEGPNVAGAGPSGLEAGEALSVLAPALEDPAIEKIGHDLKASLLLLSRHQIDLAGLGLDTMLGSYLLDATRPGHPLETTALEHLGYKALTEDDVCGKGARAVPLADMAPSALLPFAGERADLPLQLADRLTPLMARDGLDSVYRDLERPLIPVLADLERGGILVDTAALLALSDRVARDLAERSDRIFALAGESFNINSPQQLSRILFEKLQLPALKKNVRTKTASTAADVLEELAATHDLPRLILDWRALQKLKGTYIDALPLLVDPETGRVHTRFNQAVAATGRLSSSDPNLQNIPIRTELGREIRAAFIARPGHVFISADYSQIEFRVLAHLADDPVLVEAFRQGTDFHEQTARRIFGAGTGRDPRELRSTAKMVNYALLYGKTAFSLARDIGVSQQQAQEFIDAYFKGFPGVRAYIDRTLEDARASGEVRTLFGRRRLVPDLTSRNGQIRAAAERETVNLPIQGTAADILKRAMIDVHEALRAHAGAHMILTVHDELLFEVPTPDADTIAQLVRDCMQRAATLRVPLIVEVGIGSNWRDAKH